MYNINSIVITNLSGDDSDVNWNSYAKIIRKSGIIGEIIGIYYKDSKIVYCVKHSNPDENGRDAPYRPSELIVIV